MIKFNVDRAEELKNFLDKEVKISPEKIKRIYNAVDTGDHNINIDVEGKKRQLGIPLDKKIIGIVARLVPVKDHVTLFHALGELIKVSKD